MTRPTLHGLSYSPWTERARWALDHHGIPYRYRPHTPMLGEPLLRRAAKVGPGERATAPLFIDAQGIHRDSIDIIVHADRIGTATKLVRDEAELRAMAAVAERGLHAMRARVTAGILASREALRESAMAAVPELFASAIAPVAAMGARFVARKYGAPLDREAANLAQVRETLRELAARIDTGHVPTKETLGAEHLIFATFLQGIRPVEVRHIPLRPALRRVWTTDALVEEAAPLLAWRDALYQSARGTAER